MENDEGTAHFNPYLVGLATILQEMSMAFEPVKSPEDRIIFVWPIALRAHASPARSAEFGLSSDHKTNSRSAKKKCSAICPAPECGKEFEFEAGESRVFEVPLPLFERRHFYRSELQEAGS